MKNFKHPEFHILHKLQLLKAKYPNMEDLAELTEEVRGIINDNAVAAVQEANLYAMLGKPGDLSQATKDKLRQIFAVAQKCLDLDNEN